MVQGRARLRKSGLGAEHTWDTRESESLEAKVLWKQGTDGLGIYLARG